MPDLGNHVAHPMSESEPETSTVALTRSEVLRRRSQRLRRLGRVYSDYYWCLIEELKAKHRDFYWRFGHSPSQDQNDDVSGGGGGDNNVVVNGNSENSNENVMRCRSNGCKAKAMALTRFCLGHILSDPKQVLYKPCSYQIKSSPTGPVICMKPIVRSLVPSLCPLHLEKAEKTLKLALKKAGYPNTTTMTNKVMPKLNVLIAENIRQIQSKRRVAKKAHHDKTEAKDQC